MASYFEDTYDKNLFQLGFEYDDSDPSKNPLRRYARAVFAALVRTEELNRLPAERAELEERLSIEATNYTYNHANVLHRAAVRQDLVQEVKRLLSIYDGVIAAEQFRYDQAMARALARAGTRAGRLKQAPPEWKEELDEV